MAHSCTPNSMFSLQPGASNKITVRSISPINHGDLLTISYLSDESLLAPTHERRKILMDEKWFICQCNRCTGVDYPRGILCERKWTCIHCNWTCTEDELHDKLIKEQSIYEKYTNIISLGLTRNSLKSLLDLDIAAMKALSQLHWVRYLIWSSLHKLYKNMHDYRKELFFIRKRMQYAKTILSAPGSFCSILCLLSMELQTALDNFYRLYPSKDMLNELLQIHKNTVHQFSICYPHLEVKTPASLSAHLPAMKEHACCWHVNCKNSATNTSPLELLACSSCKQARYCSKQCQKDDWTFGHNLICKIK